MIEAMDRTSEFQSMLGLRGSNSNRAVVDDSSNSSHELASRTSFNTDAAQIGQEIHIAQLKLDEVGKCM